MNAVKKCLTICLISAMLLCGCAQSAPQMCETDLFCMDTVMNLKIWGEGASDALNEASHTLQELESLWAASDADSILGMLNGGRTRTLSDTEQAVLDKARALSERTGGAFDPQLYALTALWGFSGGEYRVPTGEEIRNARTRKQWDLGGAIKGYAGQLLADALLQRSDVSYAIFNLGGNIQTVGQKSDGTPWHIGIQAPRGEGSVGTLSVTGTMSVVTSGDYQRCFEADGVRYHHILDPQTGYPADSGIASVTVICRDGMTADALSTALFVMGLEQGTAFWRESDDFEAVFILTSGEIYATQGAALSGCAYEVIMREE